jgi:hypothetical protein
MFPQHPELKEYFCDIDHCDVKNIETRTAMRPFIAGMLSYHPCWIALLFRVREILVKILGLEKHELPDQPPSIKPQMLSFTPGDKVLFFVIQKAREDTYWIAASPQDKHLSAYLGVVAEQLENGSRRFHVFTTLRYKHWTGPVYFNLIRPFHHLVVWRMMKAGAACQAG